MPGVSCWEDLPLKPPLGLSGWTIFVTRVSVDDVDALLLVVTVVTAGSGGVMGGARAFSLLELSSCVGATDLLQKRTQTKSKMRVEPDGGRNEF